MRALDAVDEVVRHRRLQRLAADDDAHAARPRREVDRRLPRRVAAADDDHVLVAAALGVGRHRRVVDAGAAEAVDALGLQLPPARARGHHDGAGEHVLAVVEVDAHETLGPVGQLDGAVEARQHRVEAARLQRRLARQLDAGDPGREAEVVLDPRAGPGLAARRPRLGDERPQALRAAVDRGREPGRPGAEHDEVEALAVDLRAQAQRPRDLRRRRVAHHVVGVHEHGRLRARDVEPLEHPRAVLVGVDVVPAHRQQVALEQVADLEGPPRPARGDQPHDAVALGLVPGSARQQRAEDVLAELRPARDHLPQPGAVEHDHVRRLDGHAGADRRLAGEHGDVADEGAAVGLRDVDVLAGLAVDELDEPSLDDVERRVADGVLVEDLAGLERAPLAALAEPRELAVGEPREEHLVGEVGEPLAAHHLRRRHAVPRLPRGEHASRAVRR